MSKPPESLQCGLRHTAPQIPDPNVKLKTLLLGWLPSKVRDEDSETITGRFRRKVTCLHACMHVCCGETGLQVGVHVCLHA